MSLTFFATLNKIYFKIFNVGNLKNSANSKKTSSLKKLKEPHDLLTINDSTTFNEAITTLNQLEQLYKFLINEVGSDINKLIILGRLVITNNNDNNNSTSNNLDPNSRLLSLGDIFTKPDTIPDNHWYVLSLLKLIEMLICDLDQYVASQQDGLSITGNSGSVSKNDGTTGDDANNDNDENNVKPVQVSQDLATQISHILFTLCKHRNFRVRVSSVITLVKLLKIKPDLSFYILNEALNKILFSLENSSGKGNENSFIFNENHGLAFLISSILTSVPKEYINNDFLLRVFTTTTNFLKKFNSSVLTTNLFSNTGTYISNNSYEKQLISWIMLMGLFNYATDSSGSSNHNYFLSEGSQFLNVWKNLLTHSLPSAFVQFDKSIETGIVSISNLNELMKLVEIKNHSLVCLLSYITYLASTKSSAIVHTHDDSNKSNSSLLTPEIAKELIAIVNKSYLFINGLKSQITNVIKLPGVLDHSIRLNKLRIYQTYIKLLPFVNIKTEINSTMLVEIVNDFSDINSFRYEPKNDLFSRKSSSNSSSTSSSSKQQTNSYVIDEYDLYFVNDGLSYGLTSKINMFKVDELLVKCMGIDSNQLDNYSHINEPENSFHLNNGLRIESNNLKSTAQPLTVFDSPLETSIYNSIQHSILNDYLMILFNGCDTIGYTDTQNYPVNNDTMSVDICIELFAIIFPYVTVKIQQSIIETLRSAIFFNSNESNTLNNHNTANGKNSSNNKDSKDSTNTGVPLSLTLRKKAITVNCSVALHSLLSFMNNHNANNSKHLTLDFSYRPLYIFD
ncbi:unnamed protein product [[Candida] boidinii]|nr:unnamed protein product [[Candida] boidinii]